METTNFFSGIAAMNITGDLQLTIRKGIENNWIVSVMLHNEQCGDEARRLIPPFNLRGSVEELDSGFFIQIKTPMQAASGLMVNMEGFMKQLEEVKKQSAMQKDKADKERKDNDAKGKKYNEAIQKVDALEKEGKFKEAWCKMPDPSEYPEKADIIRKRKSALAAKFATPDLFGNVEPIVANEKPGTVNTEGEYDDENYDDGDPDVPEDEDETN